MTQILLMVKSDTPGQDDQLFAVLQAKPFHLPLDTSTPAERAEWIGQPIIIRNQVHIIVKAARWNNTWYLQYTKAAGVMQ